MRLRFYTLLLCLTFFIFTAAGLATIQDHFIGYEKDYSSDVCSLFQNVTIHEGDLTIEDNATYLIENCQFNLTGKLIIKDKAEVIIRNAKLISNWNTSEVPKMHASMHRTEHIIVENQAKLTVLNSELIFSAPYPWQRTYRSLLLYDQAIANLTKSKITHSVNGKGDYIYAYNDSRLWIKDVTMSTYKPEDGFYDYPKSGLVTFDRSEVEVQNSTFDYIFIGGNCSVSFYNLNAERCEMTRDSSRVNIINSTILKLAILSSDCNVWVTDATVELVRIPGNSNVWLHNSSVKKIYVGEKAKVWIVWDWPLFGQVTVPYAWTPYIAPAIVVALTVTSITVIYLFFLRRRKGRAEITEEVNHWLTRKEEL